MRGSDCWNKIVTEKYDEQQQMLILYCTNQTSPNRKCCHNRQEYILPGAYMNKLHKFTPKGEPQ